MGQANILYKFEKDDIGKMVLLNAPVFHSESDQMLLCPLMNEHEA